MRPQTVVERLDFVAKRIPGLKFTPPTQLKPGDDQGYGCFMSCEMYYIEIKVDQSHQTVKDVVISHGNVPEGISCPVLREVLQDQDFETFAKHLTGLHSIYLINTSDKRVKQKAYPALTALETDLTILYDHQRRRINNCHDIVHKSPLGIMEPRKGGLPVRLTYFITPYDLVDTTQKGLINPTINNIIDKNLGLSVTVEIEGSSTHKIQIKSLISTQQNSSLPAYAPFNSQNSEKLPAQFVLKLSQPLPMLITSIQQIVNEINEPTTIKDYLTSITANSRESIISLIARQELDLNKGPFCRTLDTIKSVNSETCDLQRHVYSVKLLDQYHTYHVLDHYLEKQEGVYVNKIPFTHPTSIPNILRILRQQALFNFVVGSCIRRDKSNNTNQYDENSTKIQQESNIFDITPVSINNVCVSFEHPSKESLATLEIDIRELSCQLYALDKESVCSNEFATAVLQKCWSIPITIRSVLKKCNERRLALLEDANKRRERELQELLTNNSTQQGLQYKSHLQYQETLLQSKFNNLNDKSNTHDLNSIAEFLSAKVQNASSADAPNQSEPNGDTNRSNLLRKFSCKPKAKQSVSTGAKNQTGNKILSLMLKRPNPTSSSAEDAALKATLTKKVKTKITESSIKSSLGTTSMTTTRLITPEAANAVRLANKQQPKQVQNVSLSLIRSPSKNQSFVNPSGNTNTAVNVNLTSQAVPSGSCSNTSNIRFKSQANGSNNNNNKPRKSSIGSVIDKLVGAVNPESSQASDNNSETSNKSLDSSKGSPVGLKVKNRATSDQFAIKQGSSGGLKLTLAKSKPTGPTSSATSSSATPSSSTTSNSSHTTTTPTSSTSATATNSNQLSKSEAVANKILGLGSTGPSIKYTIPKIPKSQQSQPNQANTNDSNSSTLSTTEPANQGEESANNNPSSSITNATSSGSALANKRTTPTPFNRSGTNPVRNSSVSSSTHPLARAISNPLANNNRATTTTNSDANMLNRISSSNQNQQGSRQQLNYRMVNSQQQQPNQQLLSSQQQTLQRSVNPPTIDMNQLVSDTLQRSSPSVINARPQFYLRQPMFNEISANNTVTNAQLPTMNNIGNANEVAIQSTLLNNTNPVPAMIPLGQLNFQQPRINEGVVGSNPLLANMISEMSAAPSSNSAVAPLSAANTFVGLSNQGVTSSSDPKSPTISDPSSPTECSQVETVKPPPMIPIDSLEDPQVASPDLDHPDDESDRLSIIDLNENLADTNSAANTPKPSSAGSPINAQASSLQVNLVSNSNANPESTSLISSSKGMDTHAKADPPTSGDGGDKAIEENKEAVPLSKPSIEQQLNQKIEPSQSSVSINNNLVATSSEMTTSNTPQSTPQSGTESEGKSITYHVEQSTSASLPQPSQPTSTVQQQSTISSQVSNTTSTTTSASMAASTSDMI